jgi:APA family basic amino acid/polyamine antiporter
VANQLISCGFGGVKLRLLGRANIYFHTMRKPLPNIGLKMQMLRRKSPARLIAEAGQERTALRRALGPLDLTALGVGAIIGAGIFVLTGVAASEIAGPGIIVSLIIDGFACAMAALCYAELATMVPVAGSAYTYCYATMGEMVAWIIGWDLMLEYAVGAATVAVGWSGYFTLVLKGLGITLPYALTHAPYTATGAIINLPAVLIVLAISTILYLGISESARVNSMIVAVKLAAVAVVIIAGAFFVERHNWTPFAPYGWIGITRGAGYMFFAFIGFDALSTVAEEAVNPRRDLPIGIFGSLSLCTLLYILVAMVVTGMAPYRSLDLNAPLASAFFSHGMSFLSSVISVGAVAGLTSVQLVLLLGQSRIFFAMSRDGLLPGAFSYVHPRFRTPALPTLVTGAAVAVMAGVLPIDLVAELTNIGTLFAFVLVCLGVWALRVLAPEIPRPFATPLVPLVPLLGVGFCATLMMSLKPITWLRFIIWLGIGMVIYFLYGRSHSRLNVEPAS